MELTTIDRFDHLYVVSDLHIGGKDATHVSTLPGDAGKTYSRQMFAQGPRLGAFFRRLAALKGPVGLVLAGDIFDSLPDLKPGQYVDVEGGSDRLRRIAREKVFAPVFEGLRTFVTTPGRTLLVLLGNHDLELAFPAIQATLLELIGAPPGAVRFLLDGCGYLCDAGGKRVFVTHGNEADPWNHVDFEQLRRAKHRANLGLPFYVQDWVPNAGTALVVDAMNAVKEQWPFVDLLKPEMAAAVPTVAAIDPSQLKRVFGVGTALTRRLDAAVGAPLVLGGDGGAPAPLSDGAALMRDAVRALRTSDGRNEVGALWERVDELEAQRKSPGDVVAGAEGELGILQDLGAAFGFTNLRTELREALLKWSACDTSFDVSAPDEVCKGVLSQVGSGVDVVIAGHSHLPRVVRGLRPGVTYFNTGTWARVMRIPPALLKTDEAFRPVYDVLRAGDIHRLDLPVTVNGTAHPLLVDWTLTAYVGIAGPPDLLRVTGENTVGGTPTSAPVQISPFHPDLDQGNA